jgi:hypothetical protein
VFALVASVPVLFWWVLNDSPVANDVSLPDAASAAGSVEAASPRDLPRPDLTAPRAKDYAVPRSNERDPIKVLDPDAARGYEVITLPDGSWEIWINGGRRGIVTPEEQKDLVPARRRVATKGGASGDTREISYNPELRRMGMRVGSDGQPKRIAGDGEVPATWEDLRRAQGFGR